ncbi:diacylglycerol/lipid kinase family protein [Pseudooceanicola algae]|uniref:Lipid kinase YegS n=1 Tax=Pseudooceanicola algae TaxID=1537215 RepID=A0A418SIP5_9RHOB|nr:diacylglycerol kinase family protein [Pseudooceanicola algae]QPM88978.1 lipid kinase YegS [Pseudooceanicola algae]
MRTHTETVGKIGGAPQAGNPDIGPVVIIANRKSGTNARDTAAITRARKVLEDAGAETEILYWKTVEDLGDLLKRPETARARTVLAAGGDGTAMAVASALVKAQMPQRPAMAVLPLGTFNYFARGLGLDEDPERAAAQLVAGTTRTVSIGTVNDRVFLNNASLGIYPDILKERESIYARWGRRRIMAHWSVVKTFLRFQRPLCVRITADGAVRDLRTPLIFVARSAYQLRIFGLSGEEAIHDDGFAVLAGRGQSRAQLFKLAWRLVTRNMREGRDYDLIRARELDVETTRRKSLLAFDGEKQRMPSPFRFRMAEGALDLRLPVQPTADPTTHTEGQAPQAADRNPACANGPVQPKANLKPKATPTI